MLPCPLCRSQLTGLLHTTRDKTGQRDFHLCSACDLVFVPSRFQIDQEAQKARYLEHNNDPADEAYRGFLSRLLKPLGPHLRPGASGLDYGAGPGPALAAMMREAGFDVRIYDPHFFPDESAIASTYDFITCTETAEHFSSPRNDFDRLQSMLRPSGWLGVMTAMLDDRQGFGDWYYRRDPTHISFYSKKTMTWIGTAYSWDVSFPAPNVVLFHKPPEPAY